jgi:hypothetical protein
MGSLFRGSLPSGFLYPFRHPKAKGLVEGALYGLGSVCRGVGVALDDLGALLQGPQASAGTEHGEQIAGWWGALGDAVGLQWGCKTRCRYVLCFTAPCAHLQSNPTWPSRRCSGKRTPRSQPARPSPRPVQQPGCSS